MRLFIIIIAVLQFRNTKEPEMETEKKGKRKWHTVAKRAAEAAALSAAAAALDVGLLNGVLYHVVKAALLGLAEAA